MIRRSRFVRAALLAIPMAMAMAVAAPVSATPAPTVAAGAGALGNRLQAAVVVDRVQKRYDGARDFRARFNQTLTSVALNRKTQSTGEVLLKKPGLMRWNYQTPEPRMYLSDGSLLWLYEPEDKQAFKQDLKSSQLPAALVFLTGAGKLAEQFEITLVAPPTTSTKTSTTTSTSSSTKTSATGASTSKELTFGGPRDYVLSLHPRQAQPQIKSMLFVVDSDTFDVRESVITDSQGNLNDLLLSDIRINTHLPASTFHWSPPADVRVVDTAKLGR